MLLLNTLPRLDDLHCSAGYRRWFFSLWGKVNCIFSAAAESVDYGPCEKTLSIKAAWNGEERYYVDDRPIVVDDDNYLILNDLRRYGSSIRSRRPIRSVSIFFRPGAAEEVLGGMLTPEDRMLDRGREPERRCVEFAEHLRPHDQVVTPLLRRIAAGVEQGVADEAWYEEQLSFLLERMLDSHRGSVRAINSLPSSRPASRRELYRRIGLARDFIHGNYRRQIDIDQMANAACLSKYHFIRLFQAVEGVTPYRYLQQKRLRAAARLLRTTRLSQTEISQQVGFDHRSTLFRQMRKATGFSGKHWRGAGDVDAER